VPLLLRPSPAPTTLGSAFGRLRAVHVALARTGAGVVMLTQPTALPRVLGVDSAASERTAWVVQMLGARELALGGGAVWTLRARSRRGARAFVLAGALSDALDALVVGAAVARGRVSRPVGGIAVATALTACAVGLAAGDTAR